MAAPEAAPEPPEHVADRWVDELVPEDVDWRGLVVKYPLTSLAVAAVGGYLIGRRKGEAIVAGVATAAADTVEESVQSWYERR